MIASKESKILIRKQLKQKVTQMSNIFSIGGQSDDQIAENTKQIEQERELALDGILDSAKGRFKEFVIIGYDHEGNILNLSDGKMLLKDLLWLIKVTETKILNKVL